MYAKIQEIKSQIDEEMFEQKLDKEIDYKDSSLSTDSNIFSETPSTTKYEEILRQLPEGDLYFMNENQLSVVKEIYENSTLPKRILAKFYKCNHSTVDKIFKERGMALQRINRGRPPKQKNTEIKKLILGLRQQYPYGVNKVYERLIHDYSIIKNDISQVTSSHFSYLQEIDLNQYSIPSHRAVMEVYSQENLFKYKKAQKMKKRCRYEALSANLIWHVDIHFYNHMKRYPIYGIIDDYSRKVLKVEKLNRTTAISTVQVLKKTIEEYGRPYAIWSDNGSENLGDYDSFLEEQHIFHIRTKSHNPEQNGKIERFWPNLELATTFNEAKELIKEYNFSPHFGLETRKVGKVSIHYSPDELYNKDENKWYEGKDDLQKWRVDNEIKDFMLDGNCEVEEDNGILDHLPEEELADDEE